MFTGVGKDTQTKLGVPGRPQLPVVEGPGEEDKLTERGWKVHMAPLKTSAASLSDSAR